jgi:hypothetical protein
MCAHVLDVSCERQAARQSRSAAVVQNMEAARRLQRHLERAQHERGAVGDVVGALLDDGDRLQRGVRVGRRVAHLSASAARFFFASKAPL